MANDKRVRVNNAFGVLGAQMLAGDTAVNFGAVAPNLPAVGAASYLALTIEPDSPSEEVVYVTAYTPGQLVATVVRAREGTAAVAHPANAIWAHGPTVRDFEAGWYDRIVLPGGAGYAPSAMDDEFDDASLAAAWTRVDSGAPGAARLTYTEDRSLLSVYHAGGDAVAELHGLVRPLPAAQSFPYNISTAVRYIGPRSNYVFCGLLLADGVTYGAGTQALFMVGYDSSTGTEYHFSWKRMTGYNTAGTNIGFTTFTQWGPWIFLRLHWTAASTFHCEGSVDGVTWVDYSGAITVAFTPTYGGIFTSTWGGTAGRMHTFDHFRAEAA